MSTADIGPVVFGELGGPRAVLFHGLTGAPSELRTLAIALGSSGWRVETPLLPGHGRTPEALLPLDAGDLLGFARRTVLERDRPQLVGGLSMGGLLAIVAAAELPQLPGLVLLAPAVRMAGPTALFDALGRVPWPRGLRALMSKDRPGAGP